MKKQDLLTGAVILMAANAVSKILGAMFKIPLAHILHEEGMAIYSAAFSAYILALTPVTSGLPFAVSRLSAEEEAWGRPAAARKIMRVSTLLLAVIGVISGLGLYLGADVMAAALRDPKAAVAVRASAPAVLFVALGAGVKGYFQGTGNMLPAAVSQVAESFVKLAAGYGLAVMLSKRAAEYAAAGAVTGVASGEAAATALLFLMYLPGGRRIKGKKEGTAAVMKRLLAVAAPMTVLSLAASSVGIVDTTLVRARLFHLVFTGEEARRFLMSFGQYTEVFDKIPQTLSLGMEGARWLWGAYSGYAQTVFHLPLGVIATIGTASLPLIAGASATGDHRKAERVFSAGIKLAVVLAVPCAAAMFVLGGEMLGVLFQNRASAGMLAALSPSLVLLCAVQFAVSVQHSAGRLWQPFVYMLAGSAVKLAVIYALCGSGTFHIYGAAVSSAVSALLELILNLWGIRKYMGLKFSVREILLKPVTAGAVMAGVMGLLYGPVSGLVSQDIAVCIAVGGIGAAVYLLTLAVLGVSVEKIAG